MNLEITYSLKVEPEDLPVRGNVSMIDEATDRENEKKVLDRLERDDIWAWFSAIVIAETEVNGVKYRGESSWIGCCCYENEKDFREGGYYSDLEDEARIDLLKQIKTPIEIHCHPDDPYQVSVTCQYPELAKHEQSIRGSLWEAPGDLEIAYAIIDNESGLPQKLRAEGYDVAIDDQGWHWPGTR
jgi:hypothetical protein